MKMVSMLALTVFALGVAAPAAAQRTKDRDKDKAAAATQGPQLQVSAEFRKPAAAAETAIKARDWATAETQLVLAEAVAKNEDEKYFAATMRLQVEANTDDKEGTIAALDALIASPKTPAANLANFNFVRGDATFKLKRRAEAIPFLLKARELGFANADLPLMLAQAYFDSNKLPEGVAEIEKAIAASRAAGTKPPEAWYKFVVAKLYGAGDRSATAVWLMREVNEYPTLANWRRVIVLYRDSTNAAKISLDRPQKLDLFRLMRATGALADQNDYIDYAQAAVNSGLPWETIAVIDEGRKSGKLPATESDSVQFYTSAQTTLKNEGSLDALATDAAAAATGKDALGTGDAFLASGNYARALEMYDLALQKGSIDTNVAQLHRGTALFHLGRKPEARAAFELVQGAPLKDIAGFWIAWIDMPNPPTA